MKKQFRILMVVTLLIALPKVGMAQDARAVLNEAAKALGAEGLKTLHYSGSGSSYLVTHEPVPAAGWPHAVMKTYVHDLNLETTTSRLQLSRMEGTPPAEKAINHTVDATSPWSSQYEFWITPYGFLKGAMAHNATVEPKTVFGTSYKAATFTLPGNHKIVGYINDKNLVEKVETWIGDKGDVHIEAIYREYADFGGVKVPTIISHKHAGSLSLIAIVKDVKAGR